MVLWLVTKDPSAILDASCRSSDAVNSDYRCVHDVQPYDPSSHGRNQGMHEEGGQSGKALHTVSHPWPGCARDFRGSVNGQTTH